LVRGYNLPSKYFLAAIGKIFGVDAIHLGDLVKEDRFQSEFGGQVIGNPFDPEIAHLMGRWVHLSPAQKDQLLSQIDCMLRTNGVSPAKDEPAFEKVVNNLRPLLLGGEGAPPYASEGLLKRRGWSVEDLSRYVGVTRTIIYKYIQNNSRPTVPVLRKMGEVLEVPFAEMLTYCIPSKIGRPQVNR
jgi:hypothetical protein